MAQHDYLAPKGASVILDFGVDVASFEPVGFAIDDRSMSLRTPWSFPIGTCVAVKVALDGCCHGSVEVEAMVVSCEPQAGCYCTTLLFLDALDQQCCLAKENSAGSQTALFPFSAN